MNSRGENNTEIKKIPPISEVNSDIDVRSGFQEAKLISSGLSIKELEADAEKKARIKQINRKDRFKAHFEWAVLIIFWLAVFAGIGLAFIWLYHLVMPSKFYWLTTESQQRVSTLFLGSICGAVSTIWSKVLRNRISDQ